MNSRFPSLPFSLRALEDEKQVKRFAARCCRRLDASGSRWVCVIVAFSAQVADPIHDVPGMAKEQPKLFSTLASCDNDVAACFLFVQMTCGLLLNIL